MATYIPTIGLEIHAELKTKTKLFCDSKNDPDEASPNVNICPICMGYPGVLPVMNKEAIQHVIRVGLALGGNIADLTYFDRKNYFYPDIPKGFQVSQYKHPIVSGGELSGVAITRVHLEEDTASSKHTGSKSLIDFNRAGLPLMELVTEPVIRNAEEAGRFAKELQLLLRALSAGDANMEKGEMRVEANISVSKDKNMGTKVEIKNLNSFRVVERAIAYEIERQTKLLEEGGEVIQETRGFDESKQKTFSQRLKEGSEDYRYFPEPDLTMFKLSELFDIKSLESNLPELPWQKRERYQKEYGLSEEAASLFVRSKAMDEILVKAIMGHEKDQEVVQAVANYIAVEIPAAKKKLGEKANPIGGEHLGSIALMKREGQISSRGAKDIILMMLEYGGAPDEIAKKKGLLQQSDGESLLPIVTKILEDHKDVASEYLAGKEMALQFLVGQGMKETKGSANPEVLKKMLVEKMK